MGAVKHEEVSGSYDFDTSSFGASEKEEIADCNLMLQIETDCKEKGFHYYIADSIELDLTNCQAPYY